MNYQERDSLGIYAGASALEGGAPDNDRGPGPHLMGADTLLGNDVFNAQDEDLGDIKEIMLDMRSGKIAYVVMSSGGLLGIGEKLFAVPWQALQLDTVHRRFVLDVDKERLQSAPGFGAHAWPDMTDAGWANQVSTFYGTAPSRSGSMGMNMAGAAIIGAGAASMGAGHAGSTDDTEPETTLDKAALGEAATGPE